jgi:hypothetical protein
MKRNKEELSGIPAAIVGSQIGSPYQDSTDAMIEGMARTYEEYERQGLNPNKHGNLFEFIERAKFNADAALKQKGDLSVEVSAAPVSDLIQKDVHSPTDTVVMQNGQVRALIQNKDIANDYQAIKDLAQEKYDGMDLVVPSDKIDDYINQAKKMADDNPELRDKYLSVVDRLSGETEYGGVTSGGTTSQETRHAADDPEGYIDSQIQDKFGEELMVNAGAAAVAAGVIQGSISTAKNIAKVFSGELSKSEATKIIARDAGKGIVHGAAIGGLGSVIRFTAEKSMSSGVLSEGLSQGNIATAVAAGAIQTGFYVYKYAKGEVSSEVLMGSLAKTGFSTSYGIFFGTAIKAVVGSAGAATIAATAGFFIANYAYDTINTVLKEAKLAEEEAQKLISLNDEVVKTLESERLVFQSEMQKYLGNRQHSLDNMFANYDKGLRAGNTQTVINSLASFASTWGKELKFSRFEDFNDLMNDDTAALAL